MNLMKNGKVFAKKCLVRSRFSLACPSHSSLRFSSFFFLWANHLTIEACTWSLAIELRPQPRPIPKTTPTPKKQRVGEQQPQHVNINQKAESRKHPRRWAECWGARSHKKSFLIPEVLC